MLERYSQNQWKVALCLDHKNVTMYTIRPNLKIFLNNLMHVAIINLFASVQQTKACLQIGDVKKILKRLITYLYEGKQYCIHVT